MLTSALSEMLFIVLQSPLLQEHFYVIISRYLTHFSISFKILNLNGLLSSMSRSFNSEQESNQKQVLISSLKKELYELKDKEHEFIPLENEVAGVESNFDMLTEQKQRIENQHRIKLDIGRKSIVELRSETDNLKMQIHKSSVAMEEILRDITGLKRSCESRDNEIATLLSANQQVLSKNEQLLEDNRAQLSKIKNYKDQRNRMDQECQKHLRTLQQTIALLKNLQKQARTLEASNSKLESILSVAEKDHSDEAKNREQIMINTHKKLDSLNLEIDALREKTKRLEKDCIRSEQEYRVTAQSLENLISRNKQQAKRVRSCENELRNLQNDLDKAVLERDGLENDHQHLTAENDVLNEQIFKIMQQISECESINIQLNQQMQNHLDIDDQARKLLDRRENMLALVQTATRRLLTTAQNIVHLR